MFSGLSQSQRQSRSKLVDSAAPLLLTIFHPGPSSPTGPAESSSGARVGGGLLSGAAPMCAEPRQPTTAGASSTIPSRFDGRDPAGPRPPPPAPRPRGRLSSAPRRSPGPWEPASLLPTPVPSITAHVPSRLQTRPQQQARRSLKSPARFRDLATINTSTSRRVQVQRQESAARYRAPLRNPWSSVSRFSLFESMLTSRKGLSPDMWALPVVLNSVHGESFPGVH